VVHYFHVAGYPVAVCLRPALALDLTSPDSATPSADRLTWFELIGVLPLHCWSR
jgi:hypothetical protein